jgi:hypothetical protein
VDKVLGNYGGLPPLVNAAGPDRTPARTGHPFVGLSAGHDSGGIQLRVSVLSAWNDILAARLTFQTFAVFHAAFQPDSRAGNHGSNPTSFLVD